MLHFSVPLYIELGSKRTYYLNLNNYRNWDYHLSNTLKTKFTDLMKPQLTGLKPINRPISIVYELYVKDKRRRDFCNITYLVSKFFEDALQKYGVIIDDDTTHYTMCTHKYMGIDKENPRVDITIL